MTKLEEVQKKIKEFNEERDWSQFHSPANLAKSISIEAAELLEHFQWEDTSEHFDKEQVCEELADVLVYCLDLVDKLDVDVYDIILKKMEKNAAKYPIEKCKGKNTKYDKL